MAQAGRAPVTWAVAAHSAGQPSRDGDATSGGRASRGSAAPPPGELSAGPGGRAPLHGLGVADPAAPAAPAAPQVATVSLLGGAPPPPSSGDGPAKGHWPREASPPQWISGPGGRRASAAVTVAHARRRGRRAAGARRCRGPTHAGGQAPRPCRRGPRVDGCGCAPPRPPRSPVAWQEKRDRAPP